VSRSTPSRCESAPTPGRSHPVLSSGSDLGRLDLQDPAGARNRDRPRLHRLWDLAHEVDVQEPVLQARTLDLDMVGELEATFEVPRGDALVEHVARSTVGFDRLFSMLDQVGGVEGSAPSYPPYNIARTGENDYRISVAVAGFD
jgi:hypothetical protein